MICYHHNDLDGYCSASLVNMAFGDVEMREVTYSDKIDIDSIPEGTEVYIVDYHIEPDMMDKLIEKCTVHWIDHHKTAIEKYKDYPHEVKGIRRVGVGACELVYEYLEDKLPYKGIPFYVELISDWDVWKFDFGDLTKYFKYAMDAFVDGPKDKLWHELTDDLVDDLAKKGELIYIGIKQNYKNTLKKIGFETTFEGYDVIACNAVANSEMFEDEDYPFYITFNFDGDFYTISLYSEKVDVSEIAKKYGGGGHEGAAGFITKELPFEKSW